MLTSRLILAASLLILPALSHAASDPPFNTKSQVVIPFSGNAIFAEHGENVSITGEVALKLIMTFKTGLKMKAIAKAQNVVVTDMTTLETYRLRGQTKLLTTWPTTVSEIGFALGMQGDPVPGLDVHLGKHPHGVAGMVVVQVDGTGQVTGSSVTLQNFPLPGGGLTTPVFQFTD